MTVFEGLAKLAPNGKMAIIQNGSPLFAGDAESGSSEIRHYILENDWLDAIVQLSTDQFMNTGISIYIWVCSKDKPAHRAGQTEDKVVFMPTGKARLLFFYCFEQRQTK